MIKLSEFALSPDQLLSYGSYFAHEKGTCLLFSGEGYDASQFSYLCLFPLKRLEIYPKKALLFDDQKNSLSEITFSNPWDALQICIEANGPGKIPCWTGYLSYEMGAFSDKELRSPFYEPPIPLASFYKHGAVIQLEHRSNKASLFIAEEALHLSSRLIDLKKFLKKEKKEAPAHCLEPDFLIDPATYIKLIERSKEEILEGNIYQVNLSHRAVFKGPLDSCVLFKQLLKLNPVPFSAFINAHTFSIVSNSPERLIKRNEGVLETRPIKGTRPRGKTEEKDLFFRLELINSPKERAELLMITDLMRNDLGKVSTPGSVQVDDLYRIEKYANVFHLISVIRSKSLPDLHAVEVLRGIFPGGSISGCPKLRALEIIYELEKEPRGIYTGSIGYFAENGDFDFNIAIRTALIRGKQLDLHLGGGITYNSDALSEYQETLHKGKIFFEALGAFPCI